MKRAEDFVAVGPRRRFLAIATWLVLAGTAMATTSDPALRQFDLVRLGAADTFTATRGFGFDLGTHPRGNDPFYFSVLVPEGTYRVKVVLGDPQGDSDTTIRAESRQLMIERAVTRAGELVTREFIVAVRTPRLAPPPQNAPGGSAVALNPRETGILRWDDKLTLEFSGRVPRVRSLEVSVVANLPTLFLAGDSTVTDQSHEPAASWGQMLPRFFKPAVAISNHAESGETLKSFLSELRLAKILQLLRPGDYVFIQFAHNDEKQQWPQTYVEAATTYRSYLRVYLAEVRLRGATPVLVTPVQRRVFDENGHIKNTHGEYPEAMRVVAREAGVPLIDLERMSVAFYEALGPARAPLAFADGGRDPTHHNNYGAYELAKCVVEGIRAARLPLAAAIADDFGSFDPTRPDNPADFALPPSPQHTALTPRGN